MTPAPGHLGRADGGPAPHQVDKKAALQGQASSAPHRRELRQAQHPLPAGGFACASPSSPARDGCWLTGWNKKLRKAHESQLGEGEKQPHESSTETEPKKGSELPAKGCASLSITPRRSGTWGCGSEGEPFSAPASVWVTCKTKGRAIQKLLKITNEFTVTLFFGIY